MATRRKITRIGGNLRLVAQFLVLFRSILLTVKHSFLFLFLFPLFLPFILLFSSFLSPFLSSLSLLSFPHTWLAMCHTCMPLSFIVTHDLPCITHITCHVSPHGLPFVIHMAHHVSPYTRFLEIREISTISEFNEIRRGS